MPLLFLLPQLSNPPHTFSLHIYILYILTYIPQFIIEISNVYARTRAHHFWNFMILLKRRFKKSANNTNILASTAGTKTRRDLQYREFAALLAAIKLLLSGARQLKELGKKRRVPPSSFSSASTSLFLCQISRDFSRVKSGLVPRLQGVTATCTRSPQGESHVHRLSDELPLSGTHADRLSQWNESACMGFYTPVSYSRVSSSITALNFFVTYSKQDWRLFFFV